MKSTSAFVLTMAALLSGCSLIQVKPPGAPGLTSGAPTPSIAGLGSDPTEGWRRLSETEGALLEDLSALHVADTDSDVRRATDRFKRIAGKKKEIKELAADCASNRYESARDESLPHPRRVASVCPNTVKAEETAKADLIMVMDRHAFTTLSTAAEAARDLTTKAVSTSRGCPSWDEAPRLPPSSIATSRNRSSLWG